jgi:hypothetical protein
LGREPKLADPNMQQDYVEDAESISHSKFDDNFAAKITEEVHKFVASSTAAEGTPELDRPIAWEEIHAVLRELRHNTVPGRDGIVPDLIINAGIGTEIALTELFNYIWLNNAWPQEWSRALIIPLYKNKGSRLDPSSYRGIALMSTVAKAFEGVLNRRLVEWSERLHKLSDLQGGFRRFRGTIEQMFILNEITTARKEQKRPTYMAFVDIKKAYDRVWRVGLWKKLFDMGVTGRMLHMIRAMFGSVIRSVLVNDAETDEFRVHAGVPQGSVLSPFLYSAYVNGLVLFLKNRGLGLWVYGSLVPLLLYADDIVLLAPTGDHLQRMLDALSEYARKWRFEVNIDKTNVVVVADTRRTKEALARNWLCGGATIAVVSEYKYLGAEMGKMGRGRWNSLMERLWKETRDTTNLVLWMSGGRSGLRPRTSLHVWNTFSRPKSEYACELWEGEISEAWSNKFELLQCNFARAVLNTTSRAPVGAVTMEANLTPLHIRRQERRLKFLSKLWQSPCSGLLNLVFRRRHAEVNAGGGHLSWLKTTKDLLSSWSLDLYWNGVPDADKWATVVSARAGRMVREYVEEKVADCPSLASFTDSEPKLDRGIPLYLDDRTNINGTWLKTQLRLNTLMLMQREAKLAGLPPVAGLCLLCGTESESIRHFLQVCPALKEARDTLAEVFESNIASLGRAGQRACELYRCGGDGQLHILLGDAGHLDLASTEEEKAKTAYATDRTVKAFFVHCWRIRTHLVGQPHLVFNKSGLWSIVDDELQFKTSPPPPHPSFPVCLHKGEWRNWVVNPPKFEWSKHKRTPRKKFFAVASGSRAGVFYTWRDTWKAIKECVDPIFKGFETLKSADSWLSGELNK